MATLLRLNWVKNALKVSSPVPIMGGKSRA